MDRDWRGEPRLGARAGRELPHQFQSTPIQSRARSNRPIAHKCKCFSLSLFLSFSLPFCSYPQQPIILRRLWKKSRGLWIRCAWRITVAQQVWWMSIATKLCGYIHHFISLSMCVLKSSEKPLTTVPSTKVDRGWRRDESGLRAQARRDTETSSTQTTMPPKNEWMNEWMKSLTMDPSTDQLIMSILVYFAMVVLILQLLFIWIKIRCLSAK